MPLTEEQRAELWRLQQRSRERFRRVQNLALRSDPARVKAFRQAWAPLTRRGL